MIQNINKGSNYEILKLIYIFIAGKIKVPQILSILAVMTFAFGDALTAAFMMNIRGYGGEANMIVAQIYASNGLTGLLAYKLMLTLMLLFAAFIMYRRSGGRNYWMVNGFLASIVILGAMAAITNIQAALGLSFMPPSIVIAIYLGILLIFVEAGDILDNRTVQAKLVEASRARNPW